MSASSVSPRTRAARAALADRAPADDAARAWIGVDFSGASSRRSSRALVPLLVLALCVALGVAALRIDLIRTRYAVSAAMAEENALIEAQRALIVRRRQLRDPVELAIQARARGFRAPAHVLTLPDPESASRLADSGTAELPAVSAGPARSDAARGWQ